MRRKMSFILVAATIVSLGFSVGFVAEPASAAGPLPCADVLFLGARGSGEPMTASEVKRNSGQVPGYGIEVDQVRAAFTAEATRRGYSVNSVAITYPAESTDVIKRTSSGLPTGAMGYFAGLDIGVQGVVSIVSARVGACPDEKFVLAGYSQGAMVMHRALARIAEISGAIEKVRSVVLIADGDRVSGSIAELVGTAPQSGVGLAEWARRDIGYIGGVTYDGSDIPSILSGRVRAICNSGDLICDFNRALVLSPKALKTATSIHTAYRYTPYGAQAGTWAGSRIGYTCTIGHCGE